MYGLRTDLDFLNLILFDSYFVFLFSLFSHKYQNAQSKTTRIDTYFVFCILILYFVCVACALKGEKRENKKQKNKYLISRPDRP